MMSTSRATLYMTLVVVIGFAIIILLNVVNLFGFSQAKYIAPSEVRGIAIEHGQLLYTLNFEQQNALVDIFNRAIPITKEELQPRMKDLPKSFGVKKIVIYRFKAPDIEITPVGYVSKVFSKDGSQPVEQMNVVFSSPTWNPKGLMEEATQDQMQELLSKTYDHE